MVTQNEGNRRMGTLIKFLIVAAFLLSPLAVWKILDLMFWLRPHVLVP